MQNVDLQCIQALRTTLVNMHVERIGTIPGSGCRISTYVWAAWFACPMTLEAWALDQEETQKAWFKEWNHPGYVERSLLISIVISIVLSIVISCLSRLCVEIVYLQHCKLLEFLSSTKTSLEMSRVYVTLSPSLFASWVAFCTTHLASQGSIRSTFPFCGYIDGTERRAIRAAQLQRPGA